VDSSGSRNMVGADRQIFAAYDSEGIYVYQAFKPSIADEAIRLGTFGGGFSLDRMTWIKPSFGWMLYRSSYASAHRQERILCIKIGHQGFGEILSKAVSTSFNPLLFESEVEWARALRNSEVRYQWDPDRDVYLRKLDRRAIQLGIRGSVVRAYATSWIVGLEDVTPVAHKIKHVVEQGGSDLPPLPIERAYAVSSQIAEALGMVSYSSQLQTDCGENV